MKSKLFFLIACLLGFTMANARGDEPGDGNKYEINGNVTHAASKKPLKDVNVTAYLVTKQEKEQAIKTDNLGSFAFDELKPGTYKFVFEKAGFKKITREKVVIKTDEAFILNIEMIEQKDFEIMPSPFYFTGGL